MEGSCRESRGIEIREIVKSVVTVPRVKTNIIALKVTYGLVLQLGYNWPQKYEVATRFSSYPQV